MQVQVALVGLDRVSTSIGLALKRYMKQSRAEHTFTIIGNDKRAAAMKTAHELGAVDNFHRTLAKAVEGANLLVVNVPPSEREDILSRLGRELKPGAVVLDCSEIKQPTIELARVHFPHNAQNKQVAYLVGITPVISVKALYSGEFEADGARADLFDNSDIILTPDQQCPSEAITLAEDIVKLLGAQVRFMDPYEHDALVAATEQLPALLGTALFYTLQQSEGWPDIRRMVNPSLGLTFQTLSRRSAADDLELINHNRSTLVHHLDGLIAVLGQLRDMLDQKGDTELLEAFLAHTHGAWEQWDVKRHSGQWEKTDTVESLPGFLGSMGGFLTLKRRDSDRDDE